MPGHESEVNILLTGFGPFGAVHNNPSARIVEEISREGLAGIALTCRVLPVSFARTAAEVQTLLSGNFDLVLILGVAERSEEIRLERFGRNLITPGRADMDGFLPENGPILSGAPESYETRIPLEPLLTALLGAGIPARISESAGEYVCNHTYFVALDAIERNCLGTRCLFVHVPADSRTHSRNADTSSTDYAPSARAIRLILECLAQS